MACGDPPPPAAPELDPAEAEAAAEALLAAQDASAQAPAPEGAPQDGPAAVVVGEVETVEPVQIELKWDGIGNLHKGFFADPAVVEPLGAGLAGEVRGPVPVVVRYDSKEFTGQIRLQLDPGRLERSVRVEGDRIALQDLSGITTTLAEYRSGVSGRFDLRVESFTVGIESIRAGRACVFGLAGPPPPDGRLVSPCVEINGRVRCGEAAPNGVRFPPDVAQDVLACLDQ